MTNDLLVKALAAIPGYSETTRAIAEVDERVAALAEVPADDVLGEVVEAMIAGSSLPADLADRLDAAARRQGLLEAEAAFLGRRVGSTSTGLRAALVNRRDEAVRTDSKHGFAVLRESLDQILDSVRDADKALGKVTTVEQAAVVTGRAATGWRTLVEAVERYDLLRGTQRALTVLAMGSEAQASPEVVQLLERAGYMRSVAALDPQWRYSTSRPAAELGGHDQGAAFEPRRPNDGELLRRDPPPWPSPTLTAGAGCWPTHDKPAFLRWLATSAAAEPWLPDMRQLRDHDKAMREAKREAKRLAPSPRADKAAARMQRRVDRARVHHEAEVERHALSGSRGDSWDD